MAWNLFMDLTYDSRINILLNILQNLRIKYTKSHACARLLIMAFDVMGIVVLAEHRTVHTKYIVDLYSRTVEFM